MFLDAKPNAAHLKLAELEEAGKLTAVITQNIDGLHQAAGSKNVLDMPEQEINLLYVACTRAKLNLQLPDALQDLLEERHGV